ncbi:MAG: phosphoglycerate dehydrogenase [Ignavibacteria bacterium]|nr:phosphoglycerate dehydrogenase [Ignavibacteria bacterium]
MKILLSDPIEQVCVDILMSEGFEVDAKPNLPPDQLRAIIADYDGLIVRSGTKVTAEIIAAATKLKIIGRAGAGVDNVDVEAATRRGIVVMNTPGGNTISAAEHTMSLLLSMARNIPQANESIRQGKWDRKSFTGTELLEKTIGIVGLGKIGREVASRCQAFGMKTIGYDPVLSAEVAAKGKIELVSLDEIFMRSDFITLHTPLTDETKGLIGDASLVKCKNGVRIINCARGGIVDEQALLRGLQSGKVAGAALDVFEKEPPGDQPLLKHPRVIATPHLGASTEEAQEKVARQIAVQVADMLKERGLAGAVNGEALQLALRKELKPFVALAEKLGSLLAQLMNGQLKKISVTCSGAFLSPSLDLITAAVLKGAFGKLISEPVNLVNAQMIAREMGLVVYEERESEHPSYLHLVTVRYETDKEARRFSGTVFSNTHARLVRIDDYHLEVNPEGFLLFYTNIDRPGMLASVGAALAVEEINIAGLSLGRNKPGQRALTVINVDTPLPEDILRKVGKIDGVFDVKAVRL